MRWLGVNWATSSVVRQWHFVEISGFLWLACYTCDLDLKVKPTLHSVLFLSLCYCLLSFFALANNKVLPGGVANAFNSLGELEMLPMFFGTVTFNIAVYSRVCIYLQSPSCFIRHLQPGCNLQLVISTTFRQSIHKTYSLCKYGKVPER